MIDEIAPLKEIRVKNNLQDWFNAEINEELKDGISHLLNLKVQATSRQRKLQKASNKVQRMIKNKKEIFVVGKRNTNIGKI